MSNTWHGSYLQGMETFSRRTKGILTSFRARILPTRNGNFSWSFLYLLTLFRRARILPTRNGNQYCWTDCESYFYARILPTRNGNPSNIICSQSPVNSARILPTRNGNVRKRKKPKTSTLKSTDPTYKEWKRGVIPPLVFPAPVARILPTRNGNPFRWIAYRRGMLMRARILPTRNGNRDFGIWCSDGLNRARILPTRNGNNWVA